MHIILIYIPVIYQPKSTMPSVKVSKRNKRVKHDQAAAAIAEPSTSQPVPNAQFRRKFRRPRAGYKWIIDEETSLPRQIKTDMPVAISRSSNSCNRGYWAISLLTGLPSWCKMPIQSGCFCSKCIQMGIASEPWIGKRVHAPNNGLISAIREVSQKAKRDL